MHDLRANELNNRLEMPSELQTQLSAINIEKKECGRKDNLEKLLQLERFHG